VSSPPAPTNPNTSEIVGAGGAALRGRRLVRSSGAVGQAAEKEIRSSMLNTTQRCQPRRARRRPWRSRRRQLREIRLDLPRAVRPYQVASGPERCPRPRSGSEHERYRRFRRLGLAGCLGCAAT